MIRIEYVKTRLFKKMIRTEYVKTRIFKKMMIRTEYLKK